MKDNQKAVRREEQLLSQDLIKKLPKGYLLMPYDIVRMNYVHLACIWMLKEESAKSMSYGQLCRAAIEWLIIDKKIQHHDPYELWIDANILNTNLTDK